jgi:purine-binding chemotaxis protein CheW
LGSIASNAEQGISGPERKSLVFRVWDELYACDIELVREIVRFAPLTRIPGAPAHVRGLLNVRGEVLIVLDVGLKLRADRAPMDRGSIIVVDTEGRRAGLVVDDVVGVHAVVGDEDVGKPPPDGSDIARPMGHLDGRIVLYLDVPAFVSQSLV